MSSLDTICGYYGDPVCYPPNCGGACPPGEPDTRPRRTILPSQEERLQKELKRINSMQALEEARHEALMAQRFCSWCGTKFESAEELADHISEAHIK